MVKVKSVWFLNSTYEDSRLLILLFLEAIILMNEKAILVSIFLYMGYFQGWVSSDIFPIVCVQKCTIIDIHFPYRKMDDYPRFSGQSACIDP